MRNEPRISGVVMGATVLTTALTACSSGSDDTAAGNDELIVNPVGNDMPGAIVVALPANLSMAVFDNGFVTVDEATVAVNAVAGGLPVGKHNVTVNGYHRGGSVGQDDDRDARRDPVRAPKDPTFELNVNGACAAFDSGGSTKSSVGTYQDFHLESCVSTHQVPADGQLWGMLPGSYSAVWGFDDGTPKFDVASGQAVSLDLGSPAGRRVVRVRAPASRDFPDVLSGPDTDVQKVYDNGGWLLQDSEQSFGVAVGVVPGTNLVIGTRTSSKKVSLPSRTRVSHRGNSRARMHRPRAQCEASQRPPSRGPSSSRRTDRPALSGHS